MRQGAGPAGVPAALALAQLVGAADLGLLARGEERRRGPSNGKHAPPRARASPSVPGGGGRRRRGVGAAGPASDPAELPLCVPRAGTTALYDALTANDPNVVPAAIKEINYFNSVAWGSRALPWYLSQFKRRRGAAQLSGDGSCTSVMCPDAPKRAKERVPTINRLLMCVRDEIARVVSHYKMCKANEVAAAGLRRGRRSATRPRRQQGRQAPLPATAAAAAGAAAARDAARERARARADCDARLPGGRAPAGDAVRRVLRPRNETCAFSSALLPETLGKGNRRAAATCSPARCALTSRLARRVQIGPAADRPAERSRADAKLLLANVTPSSARALSDGQWRARPKTRRRRRRPRRRRRRLSEASAREALRAAHRRFRRAHRRAPPRDHEVRRGAAPPSFSVVSVYYSSTVPRPPLSLDAKPLRFGSPCRGSRAGARAVLRRRQRVDRCAPSAATSSRGRRSAELQVAEAADGRAVCGAKSSSACLSSVLSECATSQKRRTVRWSRVKPLASS